MYGLLASDPLLEVVRKTIANKSTDSQGLVRVPMPVFRQQQQWLDNVNGAGPLVSVGLSKPTEIKAEGLLVHTIVQRFNEVRQPILCPRR